MKRLFATLTAALLLCIACEQSEVSISSKSSPLSLKLHYGEDATLCYDLYRDGKEIISQSPLLIEVDDQMVKWEILSHSSSEDILDNFDMITGETRSISLTYSELDIKLNGHYGEGEQISGSLLMRIYAGGVAYRFIVESDKEYSIRELSEYRFADSSGGYHTPNGEFEPVGAISIEEFTKEDCTSPVIYQTEEFMVGLHEADLHNYPQLMFKRAESGEAICISSERATLQGAHALPWRVILVGDSFVDLHNVKKIYYSLSQPAEGDFSWVRPGFSTWDWRVKGMEFGGEVYEMTTQSLKRYIDFCDRHDLEYFLLDAEWYHDATPIVPVEGLDLEEVIRYGNSKGVGVILYYDTAYVKTTKADALDFEEVAEQFAAWGASGVKYGFLARMGQSVTTLQEKTAIAEELIRTSAKNHLIIDFHDNPIPFGGLERQYPNYISREYCHAQMDRRWAFVPREFTKMACLNLLAGPMDQTNGTYSLNTIKERSKGPRNEYHSTVAAENARAFITNTGNLSVLLDAPEAYELKADMFEFIASMPNRWDEARYQEMVWGERIAVARRSGDEWFYGCVFGEEEGEHTPCLNFLEEGVSYSATIYRDAPDTDYINNKESYEIERLEGVKRGDKITTNVVFGGGYSIIFRPM